MAKEQYNKDQALERSPQYRHMVNLENKERRVREKKRDKRGGKKIGKKLPDGTYTEVSTPDCDWHERWQNPDIEEIIEHARKSGNTNKYDNAIKKTKKDIKFKQV